MTIGSTEHKREFIENLKREYRENIWKNELHLLRLNCELEIMQGELDKLNAAIAEKGKPAASIEKKQGFVLERNIEFKRKEIAQVEDTKLQNEYGLNVLLPKYENNEAA